MVAVADPMAQRYGELVKVLFLVGFWSAATSSILGGWNAAAYLFSDYVRTARRVPDDQADGILSEKSKYFRGFLVWCCFPPMLLFSLNEPVLLVIIYAALGALFLPFMAATLMYLLNSKRITNAFRNKVDGQRRAERVRAALRRHRGGGDPRPVLASSATRLMNGESR